MAADNQVNPNQPGQSQDVLVSGRVATGGPARTIARDEVLVTGDPVNVRTPSEAATADATQVPVDPLTEATKIRNVDIQRAHDKEMQRRGLLPRTADRGPGALARSAQSVSINFEGNKFVTVDGDAKHPASGIKSGSFTGSFMERLEVRALTPEEEERLGPTGAQRRSTDQVAGSGAGGGGNPMAAGEARGATSGTAGPVSGQAPRSPVGTAPGTTSRTPGR